MGSVLSNAGTIVGKIIFKIYDDAKRRFPDIDTWETEALLAEFGEDRTAAINAVSACENSDKPWEDWRVFQKVALVINGRTVIPDIMQDLDMREITYAVSILNSRYKDHMFDIEVSKYIALEAVEEGLLIMPPELEFVQNQIPVQKLNKSQESIQKGYLKEIYMYIKIMEMNAG